MRNLLELGEVSGAPLLLSGVLPEVCPSDVKLSLLRWAVRSKDFALFEAVVHSCRGNPGTIEEVSHADALPRRLALDSMEYLGI